MLTFNVMIKHFFFFCCFCPLIGRFKKIDKILCCCKVVHATISVSLRHLVSCSVITREEVPWRRHTKATKACLIAIWLECMSRYFIRTRQIWVIVEKMHVYLLCDEAVESENEQKSSTDGGDDKAELIQVSDRVFVVWLCWFSPITFCLEKKKNTFGLFYLNVREFRRNFKIHQTVFQKQETFTCKILCGWFCWQFCRGAKAFCVFMLASPVQGHIALCYEFPVVGKHLWSSLKCLDGRATIQHLKTLWLILQ